MKKRTTHIPGEKILVDAANGLPSENVLNEAIRRSLAGKSISKERLVSGLSLLAGELLDNLLSGKRIVLWAMRPAYYQMVLRDGRHVFEDSVSGADRFVLPGMRVAVDFNPTEIQAILEVFDELRKGVVSIDGQRLGKCQVCSRYFVSSRTGLRKSRACSKPHQSVLVARELRSSTAYRAREKARNTQRMAAVREAERLVAGWRNEGKTRSEISRLLWAWNAENGSVLGKRAINTILEKGG